MNTITTSRLVQSVLASPLFSFVGLLAWIAAAMSGSIAAIIACCLLIFGRPILYIALLNRKSGKSADRLFARQSALRPGSVGVA